MCPAIQIQISQPLKKTCTKLPFMVFCREGTIILVTQIAFIKMYKSSYT